MADKFTVKVDSRGTVQKLRLARDFFGRPNRAYKRGGDKLKERVDFSRRTKQDPEKAVWADWAPMTQAIRAKEGGVAYKAGPVSLLEHTGAMFNSFFVEVRDGVIRAGFRVPYARFHEEGTEDMPARRILTDGKGGLARSHRIAVGIAVRQAVQETMDQILR